MAMGLISSLLPILFYAIAQSCQAGANAWLSRFSQEPNFSNNGTMSEEFDKTEFLIAYGSFGIGQSLFFYLGSLVMWTRTLVAGENIHRRLLANILHLPMSFFDTNPSGRIMNRLSKEIDVLDNTLPMFVNNALSILAQVATTMIVIIASTPVVALVIAPMMGMYYFVQLIYIASARQIKRIESSAKSPIFSYFSESLQGVSTIRAFGKQARFLKDCQSKIDFSARAFYTVVGSMKFILCHRSFPAPMILSKAVMVNKGVLPIDQMDQVLAGQVRLSRVSKKYLMGAVCH
ncbi:hypothetical protein SK128_016653 [Halocaridina rubra]|uniref:ABC transmembrane type-1 domain-containing protein n=1 Tax=Halocaridina rubra TaxID=373956 RepID=A0AAN8WNP1_HALRR